MRAGNAAQIDGFFQSREGDELGDIGLVGALCLFIREIGKPFMLRWHLGKRGEFREGEAEANGWKHGGAGVLSNSSRSVGIADELYFERGNAHLLPFTVRREDGGSAGNAERQAGTVSEREAERFGMRIEGSAGTGKRGIERDNFHAGGLD
jgi:hypothetical protein